MQSCWAAQTARGRDRSRWPRKYTKNHGGRDRFPFSARFSQLSLLSVPLPCFPWLSRVGTLAFLRLCVRPDRAVLAVREPSPRWGSTLPQSREGGMWPTANCQLPTVSLAPPDFSAGPWSRRWLRPGVAWRQLVCRLCAFRLRWRSGCRLAASRCPSHGRRPPI